MSEDALGSVERSLRVNCDRLRKFRSMGAPACVLAFQEWIIVKYFFRAFLLRASRGWRSQASAWASAKRYARMAVIHEQEDARRRKG